MLKMILNAFFSVISKLTLIRCSFLNNSHSSFIIYPWIHVYTKGNMKGFTIKSLSHIYIKEITTMLHNKNIVNHWKNETKIPILMLLYSGSRRHFLCELWSLEPVAAYSPEIMPDIMTKLTTRSISHIKLIENKSSMSACIGKFINLL